MKRSPLVLIVDDAKDNREGYAQYLQFCGFRTAEAGTGEEALKVARRNKPDAILLDMRLPGLSGGEVSRRLRSEGFDKTPIIALSACTFEADIVNATESGCDSFLSKPCLPETVVEEIQRLLKTSRPVS
jgi:two-component system, cell cycle response regulator DivK